MALKPGSKAPAFNLPTATGEKIALKDFLGKTVVLYFYPRDLTPGCTQEACDFRDAMPAFESLDAVVLGVSKDTPKTHTKFTEKYSLSFPLLADEEGKICKAYGVMKPKNLYGRKFIGIERTTFVINKKGKISKIFEKVKVKGHVDEVKSAIEELISS